MDLKIKVCGMREFTNIGDVSDLKPDMMGFIFYPKSKRYVGDDYDPNLIHSIKPIIQTVGVFVNEWTESLTDKLIRYRFDVVQLHGNESPAYCREIHKKCNVLKAFGI